MDDKGLLDIILTKEGATEAFEELSTQFNVNDRVQLRQNLTKVEDLLMNFTVTKYSISQDFLLSETVIQPFKSGEEIDEVKKYLFN